MKDSDSQIPSSVAMDPANFSPNVKKASGFTHTEMVIEAVSTMDDGNGVDIDGISKFIKESYEVPPKFRKKIKAKLKDLVSQNKLEKVENRYKILDGATTSTETTKATQDLPSTSLASEDMLERIDAELKDVAIADNVEFQAKEACQESERTNQLLEESITMLQLAKDIHDLCNVHLSSSSSVHHRHHHHPPFALFHAGIKGEKVFLP